MSQSPGDYKPSRRDVLRPVEYVGGAAIAAIFTGGVVLFTTRELNLALIIAGIAFIVVLVVLALLSMAVKPNADEAAELGDDAKARGRGRDDDMPPPPPAPERPTRH